MPLYSEFQTYTRLISYSSLGEYAALVIAGVMDLSSGLNLVAHRARLMMQRCQLETTSMLAVNANTDTVRDLLQSDHRFRGLSISCNNSRSDCVVGGRIAQLQSLKEHLHSALQAKSKMLEVPMAYHTDAMDPILGQLTQLAQSVDIKKPQVPVVSNVFGRVVQAGESAFSAKYFALHCRQMVAFDEGIQDLLQSGIDAVASRWLEFGPHPTLLPMVSSRLDKGAVELLPSMRKGVPPSATISHILGRFYLNTTGMDWRKTFETGSSPSLVDLPGMPFSQKQFRVPYKYPSANQGSGDVSDSDIPPHTFLSRTVQRPSTTNNHLAIYETPIDVLKDYILGHVVGGYALCPASVYHEMALSAVKDNRPDNIDEFTWSLAKVSYVSPLLYIEETTATVRVSVNPEDKSGLVHNFVISSYSDSSGIEQQMVHCQGLIKARPRSLTAQKYTRLALALNRKKELYKNQSTSQEIFFTKTMYEKTFARVVTYSALYQVVQSIRIDRDTGSALADCKFQNSENRDHSATATILMDVLLHIAGFLANLDVDNADVCICKEVKSAVLTQELASPEQPFEVHCSTLAVPDEKAIIADAYAVDSRGVFAVFKGMLFQEVKLAKINQAFQSTAKKTVESKSNSGQASPGQPAKTKSSVPAADGATPQRGGTTTPSNIKRIIAKTCDVDLTTLSDDTNLGALGFDSLMMTELESNLTSEAGLESVSSTLADCKTVGDVERLCHAETPDVDHNGSPKLVDDNSSDVSPDDEPSVTSIIADTCGADPGSVMPEVELEMLGIDSLMISELHSRLQSIAGNKKLLSSDLSECKTVADVTQMVCNMHWYGQDSKLS